MADRIVSDRTLRRAAQERAELFSQELSQPSDDPFLLDENLTELQEPKCQKNAHAHDNIEINEQFAQGANAAFVDQVHLPQGAAAAPIDYIHMDSDDEQHWGLLRDESYSSSSSSEEVENLRYKLREWVVISGTPHVHTNTLLGILRNHFPNLPKDARTLLKTPSQQNITDVAGGQLYHFGIVQGLKAKFDKFPDLVEGEVKIKINIDGLPIFNKGNSQFWPILGLLEKDASAEPFIIALWVGESKPNNLDTYLQSFVEEMQLLENAGMDYKGRVIDVRVLNFICDAVARALIKQIKGHNAYYGCERCVQSGVYDNHRMSFPEVRVTLRTDRSFELNEQEEHHIGVSPLSALDVGLVTQFPLDPMHLVYLGVVRKMLLLILKGPLNVRIPHQSVTRISEALVHFQSYIPKEFARKGRSLLEIERWKATELRLFLLFTGPVALKRVLPENMYKNFLILQAAISVLNGEALTPELCNFAQELLVAFVKNFGDIYGECYISYNVHSLVHLSDDVRRYGSLTKFSAFPFENFLHKLKRMVRKPQSPLPQVVRRIYETGNISAPPRKRQGLKFEHLSGPLPQNFHHGIQYKEFKSSKYSFGTGRGDNVLMLGDGIYKLANVVSENEMVYLVCQKFSDRRPFFEYPTNSLQLKIAIVQDLQAGFVTIPYSEDIVKGMILPYGHAFVAFPLSFF